MAKGYQLIKGAFCLYYDTGKRRQGSQPDGDSVWFKPDSKASFAGLDPAPKYNQDGKGDFTNLRFEAIDALETHFRFENQRIALGRAARDLMLKLAGFTGVSFGGKKELSVSAATPDCIKGYIMTRGIDRFGRPVSFVFTGSASEKDGAKGVWLDEARVQKSLNYQLAKEGQAYPAYYDTLPVSLRNVFTKAVQAARDVSKPKGLWGADQSAKGARADSIAALSDSVLWPKLYRRLIGYYKDTKGKLGGFDAWLRAKPGERDDELFLLDPEEKGNIHDIFKITGDRIRMVCKPERLVITPQ